MNALTHKLNAFARLSPQDEALIASVMTRGSRHYPGRTEVEAEGEKPDAVRILLDGWACRTHTFEDGRRQIVTLFLPGDVFDLNILLAARRDHSIVTITPSRVSEVAAHDYDDLMGASLRLREALYWEQLVSSAIQRQWAISLGQRTAFERLAHLMCEIFTRLKVVGRTRENECEFPLTQSELGEAMGLSTVHVNRTLQELRGANLIVLKDRLLTIPNFEALAEAAMFDPGYLHLDHEGRHLDANA